MNGQTEEQRVLITAGSSGLGLAIVKGLIEKHGGSIKASETKGGGATLSVRLPQP